MKTQTIETERGSVELDPANILANDVTFAGEYNPHNVRVWVIGNEYGALCLVWASCEQDAFDEACDADKLAGLSVDADRYVELCADECKAARCGGGNHSCREPEGVMRLGNAGEPFDSEHAWIAEAKLSPLQERYFAEARGAGLDTIDDIRGVD